MNNIKTIVQVEKMLHMSVKARILVVAALSLALSVGPMVANQALAANLCGSGFCEQQQRH
ncbi:MAG TPA: hypothetical protein VEL11_18515 [Candidatus Bathyarchaeia archaeon]|nr:hypothetical protein [Candidatus Bathyarchaeia archaeon]